MSLANDALNLLRAKRLNGGEVYHSVVRLAFELHTDPASLYDYERDSGILIELDFNGDVQLVRGRNASVIATIPQDPWG